MVEPIASIVKRTTDASLDETIKEFWGDEAVSETTPEPKVDEIKLRTEFLVKTFGVKNSALLLSTTSGGLKKWIAGSENPNEWQLRSLSTLYDITSILLLKVKKGDIRKWFFVRSDYLMVYTPAQLLSTDPLAVRMAAMDFIMRPA